MYAFHTFKFGFNSIPIGFSILGVNTCYWVDKCDGMIHCLMLCHWIELLYSIVCSPFITPDDCPRTNVLPNDWEKCAGIPLRDNLHVPKCWSMADIHHAEHPNLTSWWAPAVVLKDQVYLVTTDDYRNHI